MNTFGSGRRLSSMHTVHRVGLTSAGILAAFTCQTRACWGQGHSRCQPVPRPFHGYASRAGFGGLFLQLCCTLCTPSLPYPLFYPEAAAATQWTPNHIIFPCLDTGLHWKQRAETKQPKMLEARTVYAGKCCLCCTPVDMHMENPSRIRMTLWVLVSNPLWVLLLAATSRGFRGMLFQGRNWMTSICKFPYIT